MAVKELKVLLHELKCPKVYQYLKAVSNSDKILHFGKEWAISFIIRIKESQTIANLKPIS